MQSIKHNTVSKVQLRPQSIPIIQKSTFLARYIAVFSISEIWRSTICRRWYALFKLFRHPKMNAVRLIGCNYPKTFVLLYVSHGINNNPRSAKGTKVRTWSTFQIWERPNYKEDFRLLQRNEKSPHCTFERRHFNDPKALQLLKRWFENAFATATIRDLPLKRIHSHETTSTPPLWLPLHYSVCDFNSIQPWWTFQMNLHVWAVSAPAYMVELSFKIGSCKFSTANFF